MSRRTARAAAAAAVDAQLAALYDRVPEVECRGLCQHDCTVIDMSVRERERIAARGVAIAPRQEQLKAGAQPCAALGILGQCTVYDIRPMICRVWGATEGLECEHGCRPARYLTRGEAMELLGDAEHVGGSPDGRPAPTGAAIRATYETAPGNVQDGLQAWIDAGRPGR